MSCHTRPGPAAYCKFIEEHTGETVKQTDWHELKKMAQEDGYEMSRKKMPEKSSLFTASQLANAVGADDDAKAALKQQVEGMKNTQGTLSILDYMARKGVKESLAEARRRAKGEDDDSQCYCELCCPQGHCSCPKCNEPCTCGDDDDSPLTEDEERSYWEMHTMAGGLSYEDRVAKLEDEGISTSDAQAIVEAQDLWERQQKEAADAKAALEAMSDDELHEEWVTANEDNKLFHSIAQSQRETPARRSEARKKEAEALRRRNEVDEVRVARSYAKSVGLTPASEEVFKEFLYDAPNWSGTPWVSGGNIELTKEQRGNLSDLVKKGLVEIKEADMGDGRTMSYVKFTENGKRVAEGFGFRTDW